MAQDHAAHSHAHAHRPRDYGRAFAIGIGLNIAYVVAEAGFGLVSGSLALLADAGHNLGDVLALGLSWAAAWLGRLSPSGRFTYGLRSSSILAALANATILLVVTGGIAWESVSRLAQPVAVSGATVAWVGAVGIAINAATAALFIGGRERDLNIRSAFVHMAADALVTAGVVVAGLAITITGWLWLDPAVSIVISAVIIYATWDLMKQTIRLVLDAVPAGIDAAAVRAYLLSLTGVTGLHDLHIWGMSTTETALTCHLVMPEGHPGDAALSLIAHELEHHFGIHHATIQIEIADTAEECALTPEHVV